MGVDRSKSLKRRRCDSDKYNFLERLLGVSRLLSQMVEPILRAAMEISTLLAQSFFMKFSLTILAVLARVRVLVQQMLVDSVHVYNVVSALSQKEQTVKLNQEGFEVFREYYPKKKEATVILECIWQTDRFVLVERKVESETKSLGKDSQEDISQKGPDILYQNIEVLLGVDESGAMDAEHVTKDPSYAEEICSISEVNNDGKNVEDASDSARASTANVVCKEDGVTDSSVGTSTEPDSKRSDVDSSQGLPSTSHASPLSDDVKLRHETKKKKKKKVAFVSVRPPAPSTTNQSRFDIKGTEKSGGGKEDPFYRLLSGGSENKSLF